MSPVVILLPLFQRLTVPDLTGIAVELNPQRVNANDDFTESLLDVLSKDFFKARPRHGKLDTSMGLKAGSGPCTENDQ